ncbi:GNAT family N-acetyltransferase [Amycolatopsis sp. NPDC059657]|uniref:GNAT family N-acetyltransferase n=1 Tax=Amycolatopsis sp. NPDC059657 TaxID=3346899 RepID=UPI00367150E1
MKADVIDAEHASRVTKVDSLLPEIPVLNADDVQLVGDPELITVSVGDSAGSGLATCRSVPEDSPRSSWQALTEHRLELKLAGPEPAAAISALLDQWEVHLANVARKSDTETAAVIARPSRDTIGSAELLQHGFAPVVGIAVRPAERLATTGPVTTPGVRIRPAELGDLPTAVHLQLELQRYDAQFGMTTMRPNAEEMVTEELRALLSGEPTMWIAELYGQPLGMVRVQLPDQAFWISSCVNAARVGYLSSLAVAEPARSSGVGTALANHAHQVLEEAGAEVMLLHHALASPQSTPFWYAQGYRPLWTFWQRRPAVR